MFCRVDRWNERILCDLRSLSVQSILVRPRESCVLLGKTTPYMTMVRERGRRRRAVRSILRSHGSNTGHVRTNIE